MEVKPGYKQTEVGVIPEEWDVESIEVAFDVCNHLRLPLSQTVRERMAGPYPYYGPTSVQGWINEYRVEGEYALIGEDGDHFLKWQSQPMTLLVRGKFNVNNHAHLVRGTKNRTDWFYWYFANRDLTPYLTRQGAGRYKLTKAALLKIPCALPQPPEQRAIAEALSDVDRLLGGLDRLIAKKRDLKQAAMQQLLTGQTRLPGFSKGLNSGIIADLLDKRVPRSAPAGTSIISFLGMEDISENGTIVRQHALPFAEVKAGLTYFERNDTLVAKITPCFENGKGAFLGALQTASGFGSTEFHVLRAKGGGDPRYVYYQTRMPEFRRKLEAEMTGTAGQKRVPRTAIFNYELPAIHGPAEQTAIAEVLTDMDAELTAMEQRREKTGALKQGMMQGLLAGKTRLI